jgi:hypothetical protein
METRSTYATRTPQQLSLPFQGQEVGPADQQPVLPPLLPQHVWTTVPNDPGPGTRHDSTDSPGDAV